MWESKPGGRVSFERERGVTEIRVTSGIAYVFAHLTKGEYDDLASQRLRVLEILRDSAISIFLIKLQRHGISFGIRAEQVEQVEQLLRAHEYSITIHPNRVLVSVFAQNMREMYGVMATIAEAFYQAGAPIEQVCDAHNRLMCLIKAEHARPAVERLRKAFGLAEMAVRWGGERG